MTSSEELLWERLKGRQFRDLKFRRQHPLGSLVLDFYCHELKLGIEVDGGVHGIPVVAARDMARQEAIENAGIVVFRVSAADVEARIDEVLGSISAFFDSLSLNP